jgi:hypothetical protein
MHTPISKDGVICYAINIRFRLKHDSIPQLHQSVGPDFFHVAGGSEIGSRMRKSLPIIGKVYSTKRRKFRTKSAGARKR